MTTSAIRIEDRRLAIGDERVPFVAGEVQFWRLDPAAWPRVLDAVAGLGVPLVSSYLSWRRHEPSPGRFDWGDGDPALDAPRFLALCAERGLRVLLKPGPWICAEEPGGGYPDWLTERHEEMVLGAGGRLALGYDGPLRHPVPSLGSAWYQDRAESWLREVWARLGDYAAPGGPVVAVQLDNEPSYAFQDGLYFSDYHPATIARFRDWLRDRYGTVEAWTAAWGDAAAPSFALAEPPRPPLAVAEEDSPVGAIAEPRPFRLEAVDDWTAFVEDTLGEHLAWLASIHRDCGVGHLLPTVNLIPNAVHELPLRHRSVREALAGRVAVGTDHYYDPPISWRLVDVLARTAASARAAGEPVVWAPELMAGIWRMPEGVVDYPDPFPAEQAAWWGAAMALGYHGFTWYMLADRENWQFAPIGADGGTGPFAEPIVELLGLLSAEPALLETTPRATVHVLWSRRDALGAYASTGTMREPEVPWADPGRRRGFEGHLALTESLLRAGHLYELWEPGMPLAPSAVLLVPAESGDETAVAEAKARGARVLRVEAGRLPDGLPSPAAAIVGAPPGVHGLAALHTAPDGRCFLHVAQWGADAGQASAALAVDRGLLPSAEGAWRAVPGGGALEPDHAGWRLPVRRGHRVYRWEAEG